MSPHDLSRKMCLKYIGYNQYNHQLHFGINLQSTQRIDLYQMLTDVMVKVFRSLGTT